MKRAIYILVYLLLIVSVNSATGQDLFRKEVNSIDSILKKNPYHEEFLGITYSFSIDITPQKDFVVIMDFDGPFTITFTARVSDLITLAVVDTTEYTSQMCWHCAKASTGKDNACIQQLNQYKTGEKDLLSSEDICVMLPVETRLRIYLIQSIQELINKVASLNNSTQLAQ
jgi:hypothetical protein